MKIFISQPMRGLDDETIKAKREKAIAYLKETYPGCEVVDSFFEGESTPDNPLQLLGKSISMLNDVDAICMLEGWQNANGCCIEHECAIRYGKTVIYENPVSGSKETLADTIPYMLSKDYKERIIGEYKQLVIRINKLRKYIGKYDPVFDWNPNTSSQDNTDLPEINPGKLMLLKEQYQYMQQYIATLAKRAEMFEDIDVRKLYKAES